MLQGNQPPLLTGALVGFEADLWESANALRGSMDAAEYKHVVLGLIFLKYIPLAQIPGTFPALQGHRGTRVLPPRRLRGAGRVSGSKKGIALYPILSQ